jgi:hypothetical protein
MERTQITRPEIVTHEWYIHAVRDIAVSRLNEADRRKLLAAKLVYGAGARRAARGICFYDAWQSEEDYALLEICAFGEESLVQLVGTTIHELAHCLAGVATGHGNRWKSACRALGLTRSQAAGQAYSEKDFDCDLWSHIALLATPSDGIPARKRQGQPQARPCPLGIGTHGGTSRGAGSGSRLRLYMCECLDRPFRVRVARDDFRAQCLFCGTIFQRVAATEEPGKRNRNSRREL